MFFNIFTNDLYALIKTVELNTFANDGQLYSSGTDPAFLEERIVSEVSTANAWYEFKGMIANSSGIFAANVRLTSWTCSPSEFYVLISRAGTLPTAIYLKGLHGTASLANKRIVNLILTVFKCSF